MGGEWDGSLSLLRGARFVKKKREAAIIFDISRFVGVGRNDKCHLTGEKNELIV